MNVPLLIGGAEPTIRGGFERRHPMSGEVITRAAAATPEDAVRAVEAAERAFGAWSSLPPSARRSVLSRAADLLDERAASFVEMMSGELGASQPWAQFNVVVAANMLREAAALVTQIKGEVLATDKPGQLSLAVRQPAGVVLGIAPWNAPVILGVRAVAVPLACGNTAVLKSSEFCPGVHYLIGRCLQDAGAPPGTINVISNAPEDAAAVVEAMIAHPAVRRVNFTGSTRVGRIIGELSGRHLKPALLELGGKAPLVVLDDADIDEAVDATVFGGFMNSGQICMSTDRAVVDERVADSFVEKLASRVSQLPCGDPRHGPVVIGPLVHQGSADKVADLVEEAVSKGAKRACGGGRDGSLLEPVVLDGVGPEMRIYHEEIFGPVVAVLRGAGDEELIRLANDTEYGLSAAVFGRDVKRALAVARRVHSGLCHINGPTVADEPMAPFGGIKNSGFGKFGGSNGIHEFTDVRWVTLEDEQHYPF